MANNRGSVFYANELNKAIQEWNYTNRKYSNDLVNIANNLQIMMTYINEIDRKYRFEQQKSMEIALRFALYSFNVHIVDKLYSNTPFSFTMILNDNFICDNTQYESIKQFCELNPINGKALSIVRDSLKDKWHVSYEISDNKRYLIATFMPHTINQVGITLTKKPVPVILPKSENKNNVPSDVPKTPPPEPSNLVPPMAPRKKIIIRRFNQDNTGNTHRRSLSPKRDH